MIARIIDLSDADYHADRLDGVTTEPTLSASCAVTLVTKSPAHAVREHPRFGHVPRVATEEMDKGTILDALLLGGGRNIVTVQIGEGTAAEKKKRRAEGIEPARVDASDYRTDEAREAKAAIVAAGHVPILAHKRFALDVAATELRAEIERLGVDLGAELAHQVAVWTEHATDGTPVVCRAQFDHWAGAIISDLKCGETADPRRLPRKIAERAGDIQAAAYVRAAEAVCPDLAGRVRFRWIFCEVEQPYLVTIAEPSGTMRELGARRWQRAIDLWAQCRASGEWPGYGDAVAIVEPQMWQLAEEGL
jgi:hypothetical protein